MYLFLYMILSVIERKHRFLSFAIPYTGLAYEEEILPLCREDRERDRNKET